MRLSHLPLRVSTGAFILNSGLGKRHLDEQSAAGLQAMAAAGLPQVKQVSPKIFGKALSVTEMAVGALLLTPFVSPVVAGAALTAFGSGLLQTYRSNAGMTLPDGLRPTPEGITMAKDVWLVGTGLALVIDGLIDGGKGAAKGAKKSAKRSAKKAKKALH